MKLRLIENICKRVISLVLLTGICLLYSKGIIPVYLIVLFLLSGTIIGFLFRAFLLVVKSHPYPVRHGHACITPKIQKT